MLNTFFAPRLIHEIPELRFGAQIFFQAKHFFVFQNPTDFAVGIQQVAENPCAGGTGFHAGRVFAGTGALNAKGAFFHHPFFAQPVSQIVLIAIDFFFRNDRIVPVEAARKKYSTFCRKQNLV
jgi:hypothetical protein